MVELEVNQTVRFKQNSRHGDWSKGDQGTVERILALPPANQFQLYIINLGAIKVWATDKDVEPWDQLSLF